MELILSALFPPATPRNLIELCLGMKGKEWKQKETKQNKIKNMNQSINLSVVDLDAIQW